MRSLALACCLVGAVACDVPAAPLSTPTMVEVPAGLFSRGCDAQQVSGLFGAQCEQGEGFIVQDVPRREIYVSKFWIDRHEATIGEYVACVDADACEPIATVAPPEVRPRDEIAIGGLNWFQAVAYCEWRGKRLPTEAEWEKAGRGPQGWEMPWGDIVDERACGYANARLNRPQGCPEHTARVDRVDAHPKDVSVYGVVGLAGNLQEWVQDWAHYDYYEWSEDSDPTGPDMTSWRYPVRVLRGGYYDGSARLSLRRWLRPDRNVFRVGVRCASSVAPGEIDDPLKVNGDL